MMVKQASKPDLSSRAREAAQDEAERTAFLAANGGDAGLSRADQFRVAVSRLTGIAVSEIGITREMPPDPRSFDRVWRYAAEAGGISFEGYSTAHRTHISMIIYCAEGDGIPASVPVRTLGDIGRAINAGARCPQHAPKSWGAGTAIPAEQLQRPALAAVPEPVPPPWLTPEAYAELLATQDKPDGSWSALDAAGTIVTAPNPNRNGPAFPDAGQKERK